jgi:hypothetical protein
MNTWIAECTVFKKIGRLLSLFKDQNKLMTKLYRNRATIKMYADDTPHAKGPNPIKYEKAEKAMYETLFRIEELSKKAKIDKAVKKAEVYTDGRPTETKAIEDGDFLLEDKVDAPTVAAVIIFEYSESCARCIEDYEKYSRWYRYCCYPQVEPT